MKLHQPILLLSLSLATALTLLTDATPVPSDSTSSHSSSRSVVRESNDLATATNSLGTRTVTPPSSRRASLRRRRSSASRTISTTATSQFNVVDESTKDRRESPPEANLLRSSPQRPHQPPQRRRPQGLSTSVVFPGTNAMEDTKKTQAQSTTRKRNTDSKIESSNSRPWNTLTSDSLTLPDNNNNNNSNDALLLAYKSSSNAARPTRRLSKRAPPARNYRSSSLSKNTPSAANLPSTPLLLLPDANSIWQTGTFQTVQWSKQYAKSLPKDTTVDIVLVEARTNRKIFSLKRFIPFRRGSAQVWVPVQVPEGVSFVLVLELYHGRSLDQVSTVSASSSPNDQESTPDASKAGSGSERKGGVVMPSDTISTSPNIVRRSDISISPRRRQSLATLNTIGNDNKDTNNRPIGSTNNNAGAEALLSEDGSLTPFPGQHPRKSPEPGTHRDLNDNDYYIGAAEERPFEFLPDELRQEYPTTVRPLELEHAFGVHQKVYTLTPYTLEWRIPERVQELIDYSTRVQKVLGQYIQRNPQNPVPPANLLPKSMFLSKVMVELVKDQSMESVAVLARDIPAETMFQYLSIQERAPAAFYRLKVQMVVVQVNLDPETVKSAILQSLQHRPSLQLQLGGKESSSESEAWLSSLLEVGKVKPMEGWEFPAGGKVIDRYEAITRKFFVSQGAI